MTGARQQRKRSARLTLAAALAVGGIFAPLGGIAARADPVEVNRHTGLALSGFDPVTYFTDRKPRFGRPDLEMSLQGVVWRFENPGNKAAFAGHPEVYMPRFGGYDPVAVARGASVPGHPLFWSVVSERLYLFYSAEARVVFLADPGRVIDAAERRWPTVARSVAQ